MDAMVAVALTGEKEDWRRNRLGKWYANGMATPVQQRAAVIELKSRSEADRAAGRGGKTWDEPRTRWAGRRSGRAREGVVLREGEDAISRLLFFRVVDISDPPGRERERSNERQNHRWF